MECEKVKELLPFIDDGTIGQDIVNDVKDHLAGCAECQKEYNEIKQTLNIISSAMTQYVPYTSFELLGAVRRRIIDRKRARRTYKLVFSAAAVVIFVVFLSMYSVFTRDVIDSTSNQMVMADYEDDFYNYVAEHYLNVYELAELTGDINALDEYNIEEELLQSGYLNVTIDDIIDVLDINEINNIINEM